MRVVKVNTAGVFTVRCSIGDGYGILYDTGTDYTRLVKRSNLSFKEQILSRIDFPTLRGVAFDGNGVRGDRAPWFTAIAAFPTMHFELLGNRVRTARLNCVTCSFRLQSTISRRRPRKQIERCPRCLALGYLGHLRRNWLFRATQMLRPSVSSLNSAGKGASNHVVCRGRKMSGTYEVRALLAARRASEGTRAAGFFFHVL